MTHDRAEAARKGLETRRRLGPRLPKPDSIRRVFADPPSLRPRRYTVGRDHPTRDGGSGS